MKKIIKLTGIFLLLVVVVLIGFLILTKSAIPHKITTDSQSTIYRALIGTQSENLIKVIELMGGIGNVIVKNDIVVIKPNVQWWNHGATNLSALKTLVDLIMNRPSGFYGEVVIAGNCHRGSEPWTVEESGWIRVYERNSDIEGINNFSELTDHLKKIYRERYSTIHSIDFAYGATGAVKNYFGVVDIND
ncbi:MAG: hypothetical protein HXY48_13765 [Ignavibacteriaceae bacterium]|nr:hypothetical protein [Ignavibacteriaceae bacterium]